MKIKRLTTEQYKERYCKEKCMRAKKQLYVAADIHEAIILVAYLFKDTHVTAASLVDAILREHLESHRELINKERDNNVKEFAKRLQFKDCDEEQER